MDIKKPSLSFNSLNTKLIALFVLIAVISISVVGVVSYVQANNALEEQLDHSLNALSYSRAEHIEDLLIASLDQIKAAVELDQFQNRLDEYVNQGNQQSLQSIQEAIEDMNDQTNSFFEIHILDRTGRVLASTHIDELGQDWSDKNYFKEGMKGFYISDATIEDEIKIIAFSGPIVTDASDVPNGIMVILQAMDHEINGEIGSDEGVGIWKIVLNKEGLGETGETYLVNKDKLMITPSRVIKGDTFLKQKVDTEGYANCFIEGSALEPYTDYRGRLVVGNAEPIRGTDWCILAEYDVDEAFEPITDLRNQIILTSIIMMLIASVIGFYFARRISKPIKKMAEAAEKIGKGDLTVEIEPSKSKDEIGQMTNSFKTMVDNTRTLVKEVKTGILRMSAASQQLSASTQQVSAANQQSASAVQQMAQNSQEQTKQVEESGQVLADMSASIQDVSSSSQQAATAATETAEIADEGGKAATDGAAKMGEIQEIVSNSASAVKALGEKSDQIGEITTSITNIAS